MCIKYNYYTKVKRSKAQICCVHCINYPLIYPRLFVEDFLPLDSSWELAEFRDCCDPSPKVFFVVDWRLLDGRFGEDGKLDVFEANSALASFPDGVFLDFTLESLPKPTELLPGTTRCGDGVVELEPPSEPGCRLFFFEEEETCAFSSISDGSPRVEGC
jgi:hypothetical protein